MGLTSNLEKKADRLVQQIVCAKGVCARCWSRYRVGGHHIIKKSQCRGAFYPLRYELNNLVPLCGDHHIAAEEHEGEFMSWLKTYKRGELYQWHAQHVIPKEWNGTLRTTDFLQETIRRLKSIAGSLKP